MARLYAFILPLLALLWAGCVLAKKDYNKPHSHRGKLTPYEPGPFGFSLSSKDESELARGKSVMKQSMPKPGEPPAGGAICVQDVEAPREAVWNQILDLDKYKGKVPKIAECKNYALGTRSGGAFNIKTKMVMNVMPGYKLTSFYDHIYRPEKNSVVWTLDYDKTSDFDDVSGHWHVEDHPTKPGCSRVFYACDIKMAGAVPKPIMNIIGSAALKSATGWVKKESEKAPKNQLPKAFSSARDVMLANTN